MISPFCNLRALLLGAIGLLFPVSRAAAEAPEPVATVRAIAFRFAGADRQYLVTDPQGGPLAKEPLTLPLHQLSAPLKVPTRELIFTPVAPEGGALAGKPMTARLPASGREFVLVFLPTPPGREAPYTIQAVELPAERFVAGAHAFLNYTEVEIGCVLDKQRTAVAPAKAVILSPDKSEGVVQASCYEKAGPNWSERPFFSGRLIIQKGVRNLVLISRSPNGKIEFRGVPDFISE